MRQHHGVEEESTIGFEDDLEALRAELDCRDAERNLGHPEVRAGNLVDGSEVGGDSVYGSPGEGGARV